MSKTKIKNGQILIYETPKGKTQVEVIFDRDNLWMNQLALSQLFQTTTQNITIHINNIYKERELIESSTCKLDLQVQMEGNREVKREIKFYNLEMIIAIGFRAKSSVGNIFRKWANQTLSDFMIKGFVLDDERLKDPNRFGDDYFKELLFRIRSIRTSEKRLYQAIKEIYATSIDYNKDDELTKSFFKSVQNKMHYSVHGLTAAEVIHGRVNSDKDNMGLTTWSGSNIKKSDVVIAKNYLNQEELASLNRIVTMYLDYAEEMAN